MVDFVHLHDMFAMFGAPMPRVGLGAVRSNKDDEPGMF
jgi:hypothetical protein